MVSAIFTYFINSPFCEFIHILGQNNILPIKLVYQVQRETNVINEKLNEEELIKKASKKALEKIETRLKDNEYVSDYKVLSKSVHDESVTLNIFFSVVEDVTDYKNIEEYEDDINILE